MSSCGDALLEPATTPRRLRIAFVIDALEPDLKAGAMVTAQRLVTALRDQRHRVVVVSASHCRHPDTVHMPAIPIPEVLANYLGMKRYGFTFAWPDTRTLRRLFATVDLVYVHFPLFLGQKSLQIAKALGKPVVAGFHLQSENILHNLGIRSAYLIQKLHTHFVRSFYARADAVICPSHFAQQLLLDDKRFFARTEVISNGIDERFRPTPNAKPFPEFEGQFVVLSVGRLCAEKRQETIIRAVGRCRHRSRVQVVVAGSGPLERRLAEQARRLGVRLRIGFVPDAELIRLYHTAHLYVHASEVELEGMSVLEAIGCGLPALISDSRTSASSQFALTPDLLFTHDDHVQLAGKIDYWLERPETLQTLREAYSTSTKRYYFHSTVAHMEGLFYDVLHMDQGGGPTSSARSPHQLAGIHL